MRGFVIVLLMAAATGCQQTVAVTPPDPWHEYLEAVEILDRESDLLYKIQTEYTGDPAEKKDLEAKAEMRVKRARAHRDEVEGRLPTP